MTEAIQLGRIEPVATKDVARPRVAVLIPCYNEEAAIGKVVADFRIALPNAAIFVYDNNSQDRTFEVAAAAGARVAREPRQGKGNVVRRMFADIEADVYVLVDGDDTYDASVAPELVRKLVDEKLDMVNGARVTDIQAAYRPGHRFGNKLLTGMVRVLFGDLIGDMLSGYRVFSRRFVKSFPSIAGGFGIETEMTVHALQLQMPVSEVPTAYKDRPPGSASKLRTFRDGWVILMLIVKLMKEERPLAFFGMIAGLLMLLALAIALPVFADYARTGLVPRIPSAVLATGIALLSFLSLTGGLVLDTVTRGRWEVKRLTYLNFAAPRNGSTG
jgi:glycosyltransferase involved in cell wall biosynthesis